MGSFGPGRSSSSGNANKALSDALSKGNGLPGAGALAQNTAWLCMGIFGFTYLLFQKKLLPFRYARLAAKLFFWPTIPITILNRWSNYWTAIDNTLIMGAAPLAALGHVESLRDLGVTGVINLCDEYAGPIRMYQRHGIEQLYLPTVDHFEPTISDLYRAVEFISLRHAKGEKCFVHCKAGHGRSAAVALSWLATQNPGVSIQLLNQRLGEKRKVRKTLYKQNCVKGFLREWGLQSKGVKKGEVEMVERKEGSVEEEEGGGGGRGKIAMTTRKKGQQQVVKGRGDGRTGAGRRR
ncbi:hypothetical protein VYU27_009654 [Nannochloropsis oceanica]